MDEISAKKLHDAAKLQLVRVLRLGFRIGFKSLGFTLRFNLGPHTKKGAAEACHVFPRKTEATQRLGGCINDLGERCWQDQWPPRHCLRSSQTVWQRDAFFREVQVLEVVNRRASDFLKP